MNEELRPAYYDLPELTENEKKLPLAKYFTEYPMPRPNPLQQQLLDAGPMDPADAVPAERWLDILQPSGYRKVEYGYCMMPDGSGYYAEYYLSPPVIGQGMRPWYMKWMNHKSKSMLPGEGNLRYKLWMHLDHWDHHYVNGVDGTDGVWAKGSLDLGKSKIYSEEISHTVDLKEYGLTEEREKELKDAGCSFSAGYEDVEGGHHLVLRMNRPCPFGGMETIAHEWIGYYAKDGKILRDENTPCNEEMLKNILIHNTVEHAYTQLFLPPLYEEYHEQPMDAD